MQGISGTWSSIYSYPHHYVAAEPFDFLYHSYMDFQIKSFLLNSIFLCYLQNLFPFDWAPKPKGTSLKYYLSWVTKSCINVKINLKTGARGSISWLFLPYWLRIRNIFFSHRIGQTIVFWLLLKLLYKERMDCSNKSW